MTSEHSDYYRARAAEERLRAAYATDEVAAIHLQLAQKYEALVRDAQEQTAQEPDEREAGTA